MTDQDKINSSGNIVAVKVGSVYGGFFLYVGIALPFWALWLAKVGMSPAEIGFLIGLPSFLKVISSPFIAQLCDKRGMVRRPALWLLALSILTFGGYFFSGSFSSLMLVTVLFSIAFMTVMPLVESYAVKACDKYNLQYGHVRSVGSVTFIVASVLFGKYLDHFGYDNFLYFVIATLVITFFTVFLLPPDEGQTTRKTVETGDDTRPPLKILLTNPQFIMFLVVVSLIQMSHGLIYVMGSYHWNSQGIDNETIGFLWSIGVVAEIAVFVFAGKLIRRVRPMYMLAIIATFGVVRWSVLALTSSLPLLILVQSFHGLTYGAAHLVAMYYLSSRVPDRFFTTAQSLYSSLPMGLSQGLVMLLSGTLYGLFGGQAYFAMALLCLMVLFIAKFVRRIAIEDA